ncbi:Ceramide kinase-like protein [Liparis tanakae]|uniref:Ceramide kinase-like protein n=1 Tax=Liparis tanakae TaxID=230148 RepID=A0A4Z2FPX9_9TELE|nr:Ceramide kinase-like protein [Liparis tanakae]
MSEPEEELQEEQRDSTKKKKKEKRSAKKKKKKKKEEEEKREEEQVEEEEEAEDDKSECVVLRGIFKLGKKSHDVLLTRTRLTWIPITPENPTAEACVVPQPGVLPLRDVFAVKVKRRRAAGRSSGGAVLGVALFCCRRRGRRLEEETVHLHNASAEHTQTWYSTLKELLPVCSQSAARAFLGSHAETLAVLVRPQRCTAVGVARLTPSTQ